MIYIKKYNYSGLNSGERRKAETKNGSELLKRAVFEEYSINTDELTIEKGEHGKPYFSEREDIFFNISHSGDYVAAAVWDTPIGIDIQIVRPVKEGLIRKLCNDTEKSFIEKSEDKDKAFVTLWALKESYIKAIGKGMSFPMKEVNFSLENFDGEAKGELSNQSGYFYVKDYGEFVLAVCSYNAIQNFDFDIGFLSEENIL